MVFLRRFPVSEKASAAGMELGDFQRCRKVSKRIVSFRKIAEGKIWYFDSIHFEEKGSIPFLKTL